MDCGPRGRVGSVSRHWESDPPGVRRESKTVGDSGLNAKETAADDGK
jgi:hypothetical protein